MNKNSNNTFDDRYRYSPTGDYVGRKIVEHDSRSYLCDTELTINTQDKYGVYVEFDDRQWCIPWLEMHSVEFVDEIETL